MHWCVSIKYFISTIRKCNQISVYFSIIVKLIIIIILLINNIISVYPNIEIALRIYTSIAVTNCSAERSFSCLKKYKNYLRSTMSQDRLYALALLSIEHEVTNQLSYNDDNTVNTTSWKTLRKKKINTWDYNLKREEYE